MSMQFIFALSDQKGSSLGGKISLNYPQDISNYIKLPGLKILTL